jgi:chitinase
MAADPAARANFAGQCVKLIKSYNFDGIDLDWEYPGYEPHSGTPADTVNFNLLLDDVRSALDDLEAETGKYYGLTAALPCGPSIIDNQDIAHVSSVLTELNLMTYDFHGSWNEVTGVNAPVYDQEGSPEFSVHGCVANWIEGGATKEKINIGFPFYGRSFLVAKHLYEPHEGNDDATWHEDEGVPQYYSIVEKKEELTSVRDDQTMTQYAYYKKGMISYDDERAICDKTEYGQIHGLNGYIIWEISGDLLPDLSTPLLDAANAKLLDPNLDCASLDLSDITPLLSEGRLDGGAVQVQKEVHYPNFSTASCLHDGLEADWLGPSDKFDTAEGCCDYHFSWNEGCLQASKVDDTAIDVAANVQYSASDEIVSFAATPTTNLVALPTASSNTVNGEVGEGFFPIFNQGTTTCSNAGSPPNWMSANDFKGTLSECCQSYAFDYSECMSGGVGFDSKSFYPNYRKRTCTLGSAPSWMAGDYLSESQWLCCSDSYHNNDLLDQCQA